ncbi:MAG: hypothetical protein ACXACY_30025 [Candidatus Hodarchaeales archaeon]|jgi:hypothetical protein
MNDTYDPKQIVLDYMQIIQSHGCLSSKRTDWVYSTIEDFLLQEGQGFDQRAELSEYGIEKGEDKNCYQNCYQLLDIGGILNHDSAHEVIYRYCEGLALANNSIPMHHAWIWDAEQEKVIDPTWRDGLYYHGVVLPLWYVRRIIFKRKSYGVIDAYELHFPILTGKHPWPLDRSKVDEWFGDAKRVKVKKR